MQELKFRDDPAAMERLMNAQNAIDEYVSSHPKKLSETELYPKIRTIKKSGLGDFYFRQEMASIFFRCHLF